MKNLFCKVFLFYFLSAALPLSAQDTCKVGVFLTDVFDLNLAERSFSAKFWVWALYENDSLAVLENLELVNAKEYEYSLSTIEERGKYHYGAQKCKALIKKEWNISNFPFDKQDLRIIIESGDADTSSLIFVPDLRHSSYDTANINFDGWKVKEFYLKGAARIYNSNYGDPNIKEASGFSSVEFGIRIERDGWGLFLKLFMGLYVAFGISVITFYMGSENPERFGLLVGSLFAAVANKYIIDSILPETTDYTLVDKIHVIAFLYILIDLIITVLVYRLHFAGYAKAAARIDVASFWVVLLSFIYINYSFISAAL